MVRIGQNRNERYHTASVGLQFGESVQPHTGQDDKNICITIRQIIEGGD
jgi:hypothetical protein